MKQWEMQKEALELLLKHGDAEQKSEALKEMIQLASQAKVLAPPIEGPASEGL